MTEAPETNRGNASRDAEMTASPAEDWFVREVLPLEAALMQFLQHNWRNKADIADLRQDVYVQVFDAAHTNIPDNAKAFVFQTARNLLINRLKREHIVPIEAVADVEALNAAIETPGPERNTIARDELRRLQAALDRLPPRCRDANGIEWKAADWLQRRQFWNWSADDQAQLDVWLAESSAHRVAFLRLKSGYAQTERLVALRSIKPEPESRLRARWFQAI